MMSKKILVIGAGRSSSSLIKYLLDHSNEQGWEVVVGDANLETAKLKVENHPNGKAIAFDAFDEKLRKKEVQNADLVVSMLPARMHLDVVKDCIEFKKHVITPSYSTPEMKELDGAAKEAGIVILNEMGVDPGIDHMSAMEIIHRLKGQGAKIERFESFTGGLIAPENDDNPWNYKFTWNPRNVVLAAQGGSAMFQQQGQLKYIPAFKVFERIKTIEIDGYGTFEGYANRDSLKYKSVYSLNDIPTIYRGTLRRGGFCKAWNAFVQLGICDDSYAIPNSENMTYRQFINSYLIYDQDKTVEQKFQDLFSFTDEEFHRFEWLDLFSDKVIGIKDASPAKVLQKILEDKLVLGENDKDMIVMWHRFNYVLNGESKEIHSSLITLGHDQTHTAMSRTVGLPVAIAAKHILNGDWDFTGALLPIIPEIYEPILKELSTLGVQFKESEIN